MEDFSRASEAVALFCRINMNTKRDLPIRASEMGVLIYIVKAQVAPAPIQIANFFQVTKPMVTTMIQNLIQGGYIVKDKSPLDKRSFTLLPTRKGNQLVEETYAEYVKSLTTLQSGLGMKKFSQLIELLEQANIILTEKK